MRANSFLIPILLLQTSPLLAQGVAPAVPPAVAQKVIATPAPARSSSSVASALPVPSLADLNSHLKVAKEIDFDVSGSEAMSTSHVSVSGVIQPPNKMTMSVNVDAKQAYRIVSDGTKSWAYAACTNKFAKLGVPGTDGENTILESMRFILSQSSPSDPNLSLISSLVEMTFGTLTQFGAIESVVDLQPKPTKWVQTESTLDGQTIEQDTLSSRIKMEQATSVQHYTVSYVTNPWALKTFKVAVGKSDETVTPIIDLIYKKCDLISDSSALADSTQFAMIPPIGAQLYVPAPESDSGPDDTSLQPGAHAPNFTVFTPTNEKVRLSQYAGKVVVVDLWATWCGPCQMSLPHTDQVAQRFMSRGVVFMPICVWDTKSSFAGWLPDHKSMKMHFLFDAGASNSSSFSTKLYKVQGIPTQFVIGRNGKIVSTFVGYDADGDPNENALAKAIDEALAEH